MQSSNLAERLEEFEAVILNLSSEPVTRRIVAQDAPVELTDKAPRRRARIGNIQTRDQGLRLFRVG